MNKEMYSSLRSSLKNPELLIDKAFIGGTWIETKEKFPVFNPATGEVIVNLPDLGINETREAIDKAFISQKKWASITAKERSEVLRKFYYLMIENIDDLALILTAEMGKPLAEAKGEIIYGASFIEWFSEEAKRGRRTDIQSLCSASDEIRS